MFVSVVLPIQHLLELLLFALLGDFFAVIGLFFCRFYAGLWGPFREDFSGESLRMMGVLR